jgi:hypothetical protein
MPFGHDLFNKTKDEHVREIAATASAPQTLIFFDTNILAYLFKLHTAARLEFFSWADGVIAEDRLRIPAWAASEYLSRVRTGSLGDYTFRKNGSDQLQKALESMLDTASLFVDEGVLRGISFPGDRAAYLTGFRSAVDSLVTFTRAFKHQFTPEVIHEQIKSHFSPAVLDSDLAALCARAAREGSTRVEHRLPPAFRDADKTENRLGDLIIWYEILQHSKKLAARLRNVLFVTNDAKSDWVYAPRRRIDDAGGTRRSVPNLKPELKVIDPLLVSEFSSVVGHQNVAICGLSSLIEGLSKTSPSQFRQLAAAIQISVSDENITLDMSDEAQAPAPETPMAGQPVIALVEGNDGAPYAQRREAEPDLAPPPLAYGRPAMQDHNYESDLPSPINEVIRALKSHNWYTQNPAVDRISILGNHEFQADAWFVLGRNVYQAACGNALKAMAFVNNLEAQLRRLPRATANHMLAGILFEIYFDSHGEFRRSAKAYFIDKPLSVVAIERFAEACRFILHQLQPHRTKLRFLPGSGEGAQVRVILTTVPMPVENVEQNDRQVEVLSVRIGETELIVDAPVDPNDRGLDLGRFTRDELLEAVSQTLVIPHWAIEFEFMPPPGVRPDAVFVVPDQRVLRIETALPE